MSKSSMQIDIDEVYEGQKRKKTKKALLIILSVLVLSLIGIGIYVWQNFAQIWGDLGFDETAVLDEYEIDPEAENLPEVTMQEGDVHAVQKNEGVTDILLLGLDTRSSKFTGRSDVTMVLRIDSNRNTIKLVSFMRDTLVEIDGHDKNKVNTAYHFGSIELAEKTMKESFGITPDYYVVVNFFGMEDIIDALDGVDVDLESSEISHLNDGVKALNSIDKNNQSALIKKSGIQHLNGRQAVAYMRIRKVGGDSTRTQRQQTVLKELFKKAKDIDVGQFPGLIDVMAQYVRTDIPVGKMLDIAKTIKGMPGSEIDTFRYPDDYVTGRYEGMSVVQPKDFDTQMQKLYDFMKN